MNLNLSTNHNTSQMSFIGKTNLDVQNKELEFQKQQVKHYENHATTLIKKTQELRIKFSGFLSTFLTTNSCFFNSGVHY
jgi:hypothetical protein